MPLLAHLTCLSEPQSLALAERGFIRCSQLVGLELDPAAVAELARETGLDEAVVVTAAVAARSLIARPHTPSIAAANTANDGVDAAEHDEDGDDDARELTQQSLPFGVSAWDLLEAARRRTAWIPTFSQSVDELLGGGIPVGTVTEVCGLPGAGKTQLAMQLAVAARLPESFGGVGGETLIIDTEGSFVASRLRDLAAAAVAHVQMVCHQQGAQVEADQGIAFQDAASGFTVDRILDSVLVHRVHDATELIATVTALPALLQTRTQIRLVVIDSVAFPLRSESFQFGNNAASSSPLNDTTNSSNSNGSSATWEAHARRARVALAISRRLHCAAEQHNIAVVVTNHMTPTAAGSSGSGGGGTAEPPVASYASALGEEWAHAMGRRVLLSARGRPGGPVGGGVEVHREAILLKSPDVHIAAGTAPCAAFTINAAGVRDV
jgi:RAD51-like protein 2